MREKTVLGININFMRKSEVLEQIKKYLSQPVGDFQIVSLNPENVIVAQGNKKFKQTIEAARIQIADGIGIVLAGKILGFKAERLTGVELMKNLIELAYELRLRVVLIGGRPNLAIKLAKCYNRAYSKAKFIGVEGIKNIKTPLKSEEENIFSIVSRFKPHLLFAAFGSPEQELWLDHQKKHFTGIVCMGVGGAFDYFGGVVPQPPKIIRSLGLEWLFRLFIEPWRWSRQLRLIKFIWLVLKQKRGS